MSDSRIIGEMGWLVGDDLEGYDDLEGMYPDLVGEMGRRSRRIRRIAHRHGLAVMPAAQAAQARAALQAQAAGAAQREAAVSGHPITAGYQLAASDQAELYLPFTPVDLGNAVGDEAELVTVVQRPTQLHRLILQAVNSNGNDTLQTVGVSGVLVGVMPIFNSVGVAPGTAFDARAVGVKLLCFPARVGTQVTIQLRRVQPGNGETTTRVLGYGIGVSAQV